MAKSIKSHILHGLANMFVLFPETNSKESFAKLRTLLNNGLETDFENIKKDWMSVCSTKKL